MNPSSKELIGLLIGLARASFGNEDLITEPTKQLVMKALNASLSNRDHSELIDIIREEKRKLVPDCFSCEMPCGRNNDFNLDELNFCTPTTKALKEELLSQLTQHSTFNDDLFYALYAIGDNNFSKNELEPILKKLRK